MSKTTNMLIWFLNGKYIQDSHGQILLEEKPAFSFEYESIKYYDNEKKFFVADPTKEIDLSQEQIYIDLSQEQIHEIEEFIGRKRNQTGILKLCIDVDGNYLGKIRTDSPGVHDTVYMAPPSDDDWVWCYEEKRWKRQYFYTADKVYTRKNDTNAIGFTLEPIPSHTYHEFEMDIEKNTWVEKITPESFVKCKKEITREILKQYLILLNESIENPQVILQALKTLDVTENTKSQLIEKLLDDIEQSTTINEIELSYELAKIITVA
jgi:hypothetical protein